MASRKIESFATQVKSLMENEKDFQQKLKQRLVFDSNKVANPFKFVVGLFNEGVLCDGSSDREATIGLKEIIVQLAITIACSKGPDAIDGLMKALAGSENLALITALQTWVKEDFAIEPEGDLSEPEVDSEAQAGTSERLPTPVKNTNEFTSSGTKLIDKIMSDVEESMAELEAHLIGKASQILDASALCSILVQQHVLDQNQDEFKTGIEGQEGPQLQKAIKVACSKKALGSLVVALQCSGNEHFLEETLEWFEKFQEEKNSHGYLDQFLAQLFLENSSKRLRSAFGKPVHDLQKIATLNHEVECRRKGTPYIKFDKNKMVALFADGTLKLWNWIDSEEKTTQLGKKVKSRIQAFQCDEEILVLGTRKGTVHLFDARTLEEKSSVAVGEAVGSLMFVESTLVVHILAECDDRYVWIDISRSDMRLLNPRCRVSWNDFPNAGLFIDPDYSFVYFQSLVDVYGTKTEKPITGDDLNKCFLLAPAEISTLKVVDLISGARVVVAGCNNGMIAIWDTCKLISHEEPIKTLRGHPEAIVSLCTFEGHLLSLDKSGKLLIWTGYDLELEDVEGPTPHVLAENFSGVTNLVVHERWFATGSSEDDIINVWAVPPLWLPHNP